MRLRFFAIPIFLGLAAFTLQAAENNAGEDIQKFFGKVGRTIRKTVDSISTPQNRKAATPTPANTRSARPQPSPAPRVKAVSSPTPQPSPRHTPTPATSDTKGLTPFLDKPGKPSPAPVAMRKPSPTTSPRKAQTPSPAPATAASPLPTPRPPELPTPPTAITPTLEPKPAQSSSGSAAPSPSPSAGASPVAPETKPSPTPPERKIIVSTLATSQIKEFPTLTPPIQEIIKAALALTTLKLAYVYGSGDLEKGGLDCSGFVYHLLQTQGIKGVPRQSNEQYAWVRRKGRFFSVLSSDPETFELEDLRPGDLMFWTNTFKVDRSIPITHVMIYLGTRRSDGKRVMVGASEGRYYQGEPRYGVSVFDFSLPSRKKQLNGNGAFVGYGRIPGFHEDPAPTNGTTASSELPMQ